MGGVCPLFFDGAICRFEELPRPDDRDKIFKIYEYLNHIRGTQSKVFFNYGIKKNIKKNYIKKLINKCNSIFKI